MHFFDQIPSESLERREMQLILMACIAIIVLAGGLALFMYPVIFSAAAPASRVLSGAFIGFCILSVLLAGYLVDRQMTIQKLRRQIAEDRRRSSSALRQASADLIQAMPNFDSFQDRLPMEFRRAVSAKYELSVLVVAIELHDALDESTEATAALGDAAKAISRKLREQDSIYVLTAKYFGVILPGVGVPVAKKIRARVLEGLTDAAGAGNRFTFRTNTISYPEEASSAHDLELAVTGLLPELSFAGQRSVVSSVPVT
ncbi:MAG TPA: GGDEF domain-containing protein [Candidatus Acidoferrales bacterium]|nr:GGDEF domain-containing protein [Candidatus Acidoferrales bacterium]